MRLSLYLLSAVLMASSGCRSRASAPYSDAQAAAWQEAWLAARDSAAVSDRVRFGRLRRPERGEADSVMPLNPEQQAAVYVALLPALPPNLSMLDSAERRSQVDNRPWLDARLLAHEGGYARHQPMADTVLGTLMETRRFQGACGADTLPVCRRDGAARYLFSAIYRIAPTAVRVFAVRSTSYAQEKMYRLERRGDVWVVTDETTVMIE